MIERLLTLVAGGDEDARTMDLPPPSMPFRRRSSTFGCMQVAGGDEDGHTMDLAAFTNLWLLHCAYVLSRFPSDSLRLP